LLRKDFYPLRQPRLPNFAYILPSLRQFSAVYVKGMAEISLSQPALPCLRVKIEKNMCFIEIINTLNVRKQNEETFHLFKIITYFQYIFFYAQGNLFELACILLRVCKDSYII